MSLQIAVAKAGQQGDSFLGKLFKGAVGAIGGLVTGGPLSAIGGAIRGVLSDDGGTKGGIAAANGPVRTTAGGKLLMAPVSTAGFGGRGGLTGGGMSIRSAGMNGPGTSLWQRTRDEIHVGFGREVYDTNGPPPGAGYHPNRGTYYSKTLDRVVEPGQLWVKNRRRNPLNPRAASRAIRRIKAGVKATRMLNRIQFTGKR